MMLELYGEKDISKATIKTISQNPDSLQHKIIERWPANHKTGDATTALMRFQELKQFMQFVHGMSARKKEFPECVSELYLNQKKGKKLFDLPSEEKVAELIRQATDVMFMAFYFTLYNSAGRLGEIASLKVKDVVFNGTEALIRIRESKTDQREVVLLDNTLLAKYLAIHPYRLEPDFQERLFFVSIHPVSYGRPLNHAMVSNNLKKTAKRIGINSIHLHEMRHWKASHLTIRGLSDNQLKVLLGHSYSSKATARYLHLGGGDVADAIRRIYGKTPSKAFENDLQDPKKCNICGTINAFTESICTLCKRPLGIMERMKVSEERKNEMEIMKEEMRLLREMIQRRINPEIEKVDIGQLHAIITGGK